MLRLCSKKLWCSVNLFWLGFSVDVVSLVASLYLNTAFVNVVFLKFFGMFYLIGWGLITLQLFLEALCLLLDMQGYCPSQLETNFCYVSLDCKPLYEHVSNAIILVLWSWVKINYRS